VSLVVLRSVDPKRPDSRTDLSFSSAEIFAVVWPIGLLQAPVVLCSDITEDQKLRSVSGVCTGSFTVCRVLMQDRLPSPESEANNQGNS
jgi:hypothetical protein